MLAALVAFAAAFALAGTKAFQTRNVVLDRDAAVLPTAFLISASEVAVVSAIVVQGWWAALPLGLGAGCGTLLSMRLHRRMYVGARDAPAGRPCETPPPGPGGTTS